LLLGTILFYEADSVGSINGSQPLDKGQSSVCDIFGYITYPTGYGQCVRVSQGVIFYLFSWLEVEAVGIETMHWAPQAHVTASQIVSTREGEGAAWKKLLL
jgi:hypothetical protein